MNFIDLPIPAQWAAIVGTIFLGVQGLKKMPWLGPLMEAKFGKVWSLGLAALAAFLQALLLYMGDSHLTGPEMVQVVLTTLTAMGLHAATKVGENKFLD